MTIPMPRATQTTLRALPRALVVGIAGEDGDTVRRQLEREGYFVFKSANTGEALEAIRSKKLDLVLIGTHAPGADAGDSGARLVETLRKDPDLANLPLLVVSQSDGMETIERCLELGADDYLPRAFGAGVLRARVSAALDRRRLQDSQNLRREMNVARSIQRDFLPESLPVVPGVRLDAALHPARHVSGDFYDAFQLEASGRLVLVVGDVCDKGVGAAMFMALFRSLIRASADQMEEATPADMLTHVASFTNNYIARLHGRTNMFATVFLATLEPDRGELVYVNAGHEPALVIAPDGGIETLRPTGPALGLMPDVAFRAVERSLGRGHSLFAFTDGIVEARSASGDVFGAERLREVLRSHREGGASTLVGGVLEAQRSFSRQAEPHDDVTMLAATLQSPHSPPAVRESADNAR